MNREIFLSFSSNPSSFGETVHNAAYRSQNLNFFYKAVKVSDIKKAIEAVRVLQVKGCSISMPFKEKVIEFIDKKAPEVLATGASNTILNQNNVLHGFNTDVYGARKSLEKIEVDESDKVLVLGAGGVARSILLAMKDLSITDITISTRDKKKGLRLSKIFDCKFIEWQHRNMFEGTTIINATPIGMKNFEQKIPIGVEQLTNYQKVFDVVVKNEDTNLIKAAKKLGIKNVSGLYMTFFQAFKQYKIYTKKDAPIENMLSAFNGQFEINFKL